VPCAAHNAGLHFITWPTAPAALSRWLGAVITVRLLQAGSEKTPLWRSCDATASLVSQRRRVQHERRTTALRSRQTDNSRALGRKHNPVDMIGRYGEAPRLTGHSIATLLTYHHEQP